MDKSHIVVHPATTNAGREIFPAVHRHESEVIRPLAELHRAEQRLKAEIAAKQEELRKDRELAEHLQAQLHDRQVNVAVVENCLYNARGRMAAHKERLPQLEIEVEDILCEPMGQSHTEDHRQEYDSRMFQLDRLPKVIKKLEADLVEAKAEVERFAKLHGVGPK